MGRLDIYMEVSGMSSFLTMPREWHFQQLLHMLASLKIHHKARIVFDPSYPEIYEEIFKKLYCGDIYGNDTEPVPSNVPMSFGSVFMMRAYVDAIIFRV